MRFEFIIISILFILLIVRGFIWILSRLSELPKDALRFTDSVLRMVQIILIVVEFIVMAVA